MNTEWTNLLLQGFAGGITGYVTNNYALNMLFREYTPLKLGGVIKKTKTEFIAAISELVERDLLSPAHLKNEFLKEEALEEWNILFASLWDEFFQAEFQQIPLEEIPGIQKSLAGWIDTLVEEGLRPIKDGRIAVPELKLETLLSEDSFAFLMKRIIMQSSAEIQQGSMIDELLQNLLKPLEGKRLSDFLTEEDLQSTIREFNKILNLGIEAFEREPKKLDQSISRLLEAEVLLKTLERWESTWGNSPFSALLKEEQIDEINQKLLGLLDRLSQEEELTILAKEISSQISTAALLDRPLLSWLDDPSKQAARVFFHDLYENGFERLLHFLDNREEELKTRIKRAAQIELDSQAGMLAGMIQDPLHKTIDQFNLKQFLRGYRQEGEEALIRLLESKSLRDFGFTPTEDQLKKLAQAGIQTAKRHFDSAFEDFLQKTPVEIIGSNWTERFQSEGKILVVQGISPLIHRWIAQQKDLETWQASISSLIQIQWSKATSNQLLGTIKSLNLQPLQNALFDQIDPLYMTVKDKLISAEWVQSILSRDEVQNGIKHQIDQMAASQLKEPIHHLLSRFNQTESRNAFGENLIALIEKHGEEFLDGQIASLVKTNLEQRDEEEIVELAHDFIGRELQPITKFGFLLGVIAGVLLALFPLPKTVMVGPIDLFPLGVFAAVGVLTNWIALQMIFRPYKEIKWMKKIPFFRHFAHGYLLKNQSVFAKNLAKFVDESLLNRNMIQQLFSDRKKSLKQRWLKWIPERLPSWGAIALNRKQKELAGGIGHQAQNVIKTQSDPWGHALAASLGAQELPTDDSRLQNWLGDNGSKMIHQGISSWHAANQTQPISTWLGSENLPSLLLPLLERRDWKLPTNHLREPIETIAAHWLINRSLPKENTSFECVMGGFPAAWIRGSQDQIINGILQTATREIQSRESSLSDSVNQSIQNGLNFLQRGGFVLMGGPALIERILHRILTEELPGFLDKEHEEITLAFTPVIEQFLSQEQAEGWHLEAETQSSLKSLVRDGLDLVSTTGGLSADQFPLNLAACNQLINRVRSDESWIHRALAREISHLAEPVLNAISLQDAMALIPKQSILAITDTLKTAPDYENNQQEGWRQIAGTLTRNTVVGDWIPVSLLTQQLKELLRTIGESPDYQLVFSGMAESALPALANQVMSNELLVDWLAENSFDPLYQAAHAQLPALLSTLSFQDHIINEVDALSPRGIHEIFLSFAGEYFFRLEIYGLFGAIFGLHPILPGLALVSEGWHSVKRKQNKGEKT